MFKSKWIVFFCATLGGHDLFAETAAEITAAKAAQLAATFDESRRNFVEIARSIIADPVEVPENFAQGEERYMIKLKRKCAMIEFVGTRRVAELADLLVLDIAFTGTSLFYDKPLGAQLPLPSVEALIKIGKPATLAVIKKMRTTQGFLRDTQFEVDENQNIKPKSQWKKITNMEAEFYLMVLAGVEGIDAAEFLLEHPPDGKPEELKSARELAKKLFAEWRVKPPDVLEKLKAAREK